LPLGGSRKLACGREGIEKGCIRIWEQRTRSFLIQRSVHLTKDWYFGVFSTEKLTYIHTKTCTGACVRILFILATNKKQSRCPSVDE
jgi:hypothetical protein